jgi:hypothetical protein
MEHSLHLGARHFVEGVAPAPGQAVLKNIHKAFINTRVDNKGALDIDQLDDELQGYDDVLGSADDDENSDEEGEAFSVGDTIGKALALVTQIRKSPQARAFFHRTCEEVDVPPLELLKWIRTRWASLFNFLDRMLVLREVILISW